MAVKGPYMRMMGTPYMKFEGPYVLQYLYDKGLQMMGTPHMTFKRPHTLY